MAASVFHQVSLPSDQRVLFSVRRRTAVPQAASPGATEVTSAPVLFLKQLIEAGKYRAVIDRYYLLEQVIDATRYVETEQKTGNVVLTVSGDSRWDSWIKEPS